MTIAHAFLARAALLSALLSLSGIVAAAPPAGAQNPPAAGANPSAIPDTLPLPPAPAAHINIPQIDIPAIDIQIDESVRHKKHHGGDNDVVNIGHDSHLAAGAHADSVVSVFGSSTSEGDAQNVVSVLGNTRATGPVHENAVAVIGDTYVDSVVDGDVVAVLGDVELGPHADVHGDVVAAGGTVERDPAAAVHGDLQSIGGHWGGFKGLRTWFRECALYVRPLAFVGGISWAWSLALGFLALYAVLALLFRNGVNACVQTIETQPGASLLAALLAVLLTPVVLTLLCITLIGIPAVPFVMIALFCAGLFGKAAVLAWLGKRILGGRAVGALAEPAVAVLLGGVIMLALYVVPIVGFFAYLLFGFFGLGVAVLSLILAAKARRSTHGPVPGGAQAAPGGAQAAAAGSTATAAGTATVDPLFGATTAESASAAAAADPAGTAPAGTAPAGTAPGGRQAPLVDAALPRAGFWIRMLALLIDSIVVGIVTSVVFNHSHFQLILLAAYGAVMWKLRGATVGGIVFDLHVVRQDGQPMDWQTSIVRALSCFLSLAVAGLGFFWIAFDDAKQAWHDKIAGTVVVVAPKSRPAV